ncbi:hypothetical protein V5E97_10980 [Singulisphaera sp. Ch08]|uniref:Uncharacterized protein n=1 Tax=Singulisphaera sp. Ch08 TaxID=3120278 RepID=A0AAU7CMR9_9BACT
MSSTDNRRSALSRGQDVQPRGEARGYTRSPWIPRNGFDRLRNAVLSPEGHGLGLGSLDAITIAIAIAYRART